MNRDSVVEKVSKIGKDRFVLLIIAGIICVLLSNNSVDIISKQEGQKSSSHSGWNDERKENQKGNVDDLQMQAAEGNLKYKDSYSMTEYEQYYGQRLEAFLSQMYGAGRVRVLVFMKNSNELVVAKNCPYTRKNEEEKNGGESRSVLELSNEEDVVLYEKESGEKVPLVLKEMAPQVGGIVVLAQGGDKKVVATEISCLLQALFGIDEHKIRVAKLRE